MDRIQSAIITIAQELFLKWCRQPHQTDGRERSDEEWAALEAEFLEDNLKMIERDIRRQFELME